MKQLATLRGLAILAVVAGHAPYYGMLALTWGWWGYRFDGSTSSANWSWVGSPIYYILVGLNQLSLVSVPLFLFASGYFTMYAARGQAENLRRRVIVGWLKGLLGPYLIWFAVSIAMYLLLVAFSGRPLALISFAERRALDYYYVPLFAQFLLLSPILVWFALRHPWLLLLLSAAIELASEGLHYVSYTGAPSSRAVQIVDTWGWLFCWQWILFFSLGLVVARFQGTLRLQLSPFRWWLLGIVGGLGAAEVAEIGLLHHLGHDYFDNASWKLTTLLYAFAGILLVVTVNWRDGRVIALIERLGTRSYGIYLLQPIVLDYGTKILHVIAPAVLAQPLVFEPLLIIAGLGVPVLIMALVASPPLRRYHRLLFGSAPFPSRGAARGQQLSEDHARRGYARTPAQL